MALNRFMAVGERQASTGTESPGPANVDAPAPRTVSPSTSVDAESTLEGKLRCKQTLRIDGFVKGEIDCEKAVLLGEGGKVHASIVADEVQIAGTVKGDITARRKITLARTAVVTGDLTTPGIVIEEGARLKGRIVIGSEAEEQVAESKPEARKAPAPKKAAAARPKPDAAPAPAPATA